MLTALRWVGACYLVYLAGGLLRQLWLARRDRGADSQAPPEPVAETGSYVRGLAGNLTNPKRWLFCLTVLPQFLGQATAPVSQLAMLGATFLVVTSAWECTLVMASSRIAPQLRRPGARQLLDAVSATVFLGLSAGLVAT